MIRRIAVAVTAALLLAACGSSGDGGARVHVSFGEPLRVGPVTWKVTVDNDTSRPLDLTFATGKRADITLARRGSVVYRWSRGQMFTQVVENERIAAGRSRTFTLDEPGLDVDPGSYTLTATITAANRDDLRTTREVTVEAM